MSASTRGVLVSRHITSLRAQLLGALAAGWALGGCGGSAENGEQPAGQSTGAQPAAEQQAERLPQRPSEGCPDGDDEVDCYSLFALDSAARYREASEASVSISYSEDGCVDARTAFAASNGYNCGPYPAGEGVRRDNECCYFHCQGSPACGRPFVVAGESRVAGVCASLGWLRGEPLAVVGASEAGGSSEVGAEWLRDALAEHASVASFSAFNLSLLALGAPAGLVRASAAAALDEVYHAAACFELASEYGGGAVGPAPLDMSELRVDSDLATVAERAFLDGCVGETTAALIARASLDECDAPRVRAVLERIALDEAKHAELAWQFVAWALGRGGEGVARVLASALDRATSTLASTTCRASAAAPAEWHRAGRLSHGERAHITEQALREIVRPALAALLSRHRSLAPAVPGIAAECLPLAV